MASRSPPGQSAEQDRSSGSVTSPPIREPVMTFPGTRSSPSCPGWSRPKGAPGSAFLPRTRGLAPCCGPDGDWTNSTYTWRLSQGLSTRTHWVRPPAWRSRFSSLPGMHTGHTKSMTVTTIKVDTAVRDCLGAVARAQGITMAALLRDVCSQLEARQEWAIIDASYERLRHDDPKGWAEDLGDLQGWDSVASGLGDAAGEGPGYNPGGP